jgi:hypothetical protein
MHLLPSYSSTYFSTQDIVDERYEFGSQERDSRFFESKGRNAYQACAINLSYEKLSAVLSLEDWVQRVREEGRQSKPQNHQSVVLGDQHPVTTSSLQDKVTVC